MCAVFVSPAKVKVFTEHHALVIDVREHDEWRREHIPGSRCMPLGDITPGSFNDKALSHHDTVIFHCQSGMRTEKATDQLLASVHPANAVIMQGGINAWKAAGFQLIIDRRQPLPLMRQVQITAGALALGGTLAGATLASVFYLIPGFVGAGLLFAGITGWCGMAELLAFMPWNKRQG